VTIWWEKETKKRESPNKKKQNIQTFFRSSQLQLQQRDQKKSDPMSVSMHKPWRGRKNIAYRVQVKIERAMLKGGFRVSV
jgi:hypothetical protein